MLWHLGMYCSLEVVPVLSYDRYIATPLMSKPVIERLTAQLKAQGSGFALVEDSVKAVMWISTNRSINGIF
jgi:hypothetical protein